MLSNRSKSIKMTEIFLMTLSKGMTRKLDHLRESAFVCFIPRIDGPEQVHGLSKTMTIIMKKTRLVSNTRMLASIRHKQ